MKFSLRGLTMKIGEQAALSYIQSDSLPELDRDTELSSSEAMLDEAQPNRSVSDQARVR